MTFAAPLKAAWTTARLLIAFHRDRNQTRRETPLLWPPPDATAHLSDTSGDKDVIVQITGDGAAGDVEIALQSDRLILRREQPHPTGWRGIVAEHDRVTVKVGSAWITIGADGSIKRAQGTETSWVEADGTFFRFEGETEIMVSSDGTTLSRRTDTRIDAITRDGVVSRTRDGAS